MPKNVRRVLFKKRIYYIVGRKKLTLSGWAMQMDARPGTLRARQKRGWSIKETLFTPVQNYEWQKPITYKGETLTIRQWSIKTGLSYCVIHSRLKKGAQLEYLFLSITDYKKVTRKKHATQYSYKGKRQSLREWSQEMKIDYTTLRTRIRSGWSFRKAVSTPRLWIGPRSPEVKGDLTAYA